MCSYEKIPCNETIFVTDQRRLQGRPAATLRQTEPHRRPIRMQGVDAGYSPETARPPGES